MSSASLPPSPARLRTETTYEADATGWAGCWQRNRNRKYRCV